MQRVSTNATLFLKLFFPVYWAVFFGMFTLFALFYNDSELIIFQSWTVKFTVLGIYILFFLLFYFTLFQLQRVEMADTHYVVSNYLNTYKYVFEDVEKITETPFLRWIIVTIHLKGKGSLGKKIIFLANKRLYTDFMNENPSVSSLRV